MIRIDGERGGGEFVINSFFFYPHELDVVLHPRQSLDLSSRGTTSPAPDGPTVKPTWCLPLAKGLNLRRGAPRRRGRPGIRQIGRGASPRPKP